MAWPLLCRDEKQEQQRVKPHDGQRKSTHVPHLSAHGLARAGAGEEAGWRFHLTDPHTGKRYGFTSPTTLLTALQQAASEPTTVEEGS